MNALISICIPTYNGEKYLSQTLDSLREQTILEKCEVVIVDDGSSDTTVEIAEKFQSENPGHVHIYHNQKNLGLVGNWNRCLELAKGEWIQFLFQDDLLMPFTFEKFLSAANSSGCRLILCDRKFVFENVAPARQEKFENVLPRITREFQNCAVSPEETLTLFSKNFIVNFLGEPVCGFFHRSIIHDYGMFDTRLRQICDFEYWLRIAANENVFILNEELVNFRVHNESQTNKNLKHSKLQRYYADRFVLCESLMTESFYRELRTGKLGKMFSSLINELMKKVIQRYGYFQVRKFIDKGTHMDELTSTILKRNPSLMVYTAYRQLQYLLN